MTDKELFDALYAKDVSEKIEKKNNLNYLSWAWAWAEFKKAYPDAEYSVAKNDENIPLFGNSQIGYFVYTTVTAGSKTYEMWLPVMDNRNNPIKNPNSFEINKSVMRCLAKNIAMFGLGLYIYAGEDLPDVEPDTQDEQPPKQATGKKKQNPKEPKPQKQPEQELNEQAQRDLAKKNLLDAVAEKGLVPEQVSVIIGETFPGKSKFAELNLTEIQKLTTIIKGD